MAYNWNNRGRPRRRASSRTRYPDTPYTRDYEFAELEDTDTFRRSPGPVPWNTWDSGPIAPVYTPSFIPPPPGAQSPWQPPWGGVFLPPTSPASYGFAELEDTDRLPRPSDFSSWGRQSPFRGLQPMPPPTWMDAPPSLVDAGFGQTQLGTPVGPITPTPMQSAWDAWNAGSPFIPPTSHALPPPFPGQSPFPALTFRPMTPSTPGPDVQPVLFTKRYPYDRENLAARPSDWRYDYVPPLRHFRCLSRLTNPPSDRIKINLEHCHLSPLLLMPTNRRPIMSFDLRSDDPFDPTNLELLTTSGRPFNPTDLCQLATTRPVRRLRFYHPRLPWYIDVRASQPNGVLVGDVLHQIHHKVHRPIRPEDFSNTVLDAADREMITDAYRARCDDRVEIMQEGVQRVDFLGTDCILQGFVQGRSGMWLMKTIRINRNMDG
ncbi:hypothetical protein DFH07DRAFT_836192 [Mycena maculata]|uniref:DUF6699 domain-containing protein n=1 Tax=Mycena maculata TaxID=230809 RepID=A0AAD7II19_9AGAR|nr:hypothetical protein DFH07DRAFT_836192 [Mycena maculata]